MKNILVIDSAENCAYDIFSASETAFEKIFPSGQDIEFIEDVEKRLNEDEFTNLFEAIWKSPIKKSEVKGIHGTLFYGLEFKKKYYANKKDSDLNAAGGR